MLEASDQIHYWCLWNKRLDDRLFKNQILRALYSISNNIAEGFERETPKEFKRFLVIAKASNGEVRSMLYLAEHFNYISKNEFESFKNESEEISKMIGGLINYLNSKIENWKTLFW